jgi:predicted ATPase/DNA-binding SARP family transcriptional activator
VSIVLNLLEDVRWRGQPVPGDRPQALLAALGQRGGRVVRAEELVELVWGDETPANGLKSLQVVVSRTRSVCGADAIVREGVGYRLGARPDEVDASRVAMLVRDAVKALEGDAAGAAALAREALALAGDNPETGDGPLAEVRRTAREDAATARVIAARAASRMGEHAAAVPVLEAAHRERPRDEALLADLLRSEAVVRGPAMALERYDRYRRDLRERLGSDPGELLSRTHRSLLAHDRPVRNGVRYDATTLIGRDTDLERLRALLAGSRVVSIVGPGGLGKTRLAHALAREAAQPVVHVVELVGVTAAEDVVAEVGSVLGIRDAVTGRRTLTAEQRSDTRARIAQRLGQAPGLLVLDNCEHLIAAVAELVAFLVSATPDLSVLTTSRAPLAIAAERVYQLGQLDDDDAAELFRERAGAARPGVHLDDRVVASIVRRLDGLPLAIELAAAKARAMAVEEIDRRLADRFALLRGGDRGAPRRHQALLTVIEWSWNLLDDPQQRALRWLALFHDGFTLDAAESVLGDQAADAVRGLVDQSLLSVEETQAGVRYRMLETVREFGRMRLAEAGEGASAAAALRRWATEFSAHHGPRIAGTGQFEAIDALSAEEVNLADELRGALADGDRSSLVVLLASVGVFWTLRGAHVRLLALAQAVGDALRDWEPPPDLADIARAAVTITLTNAIMTGNESVQLLLATLRRLGPGSGSSDDFPLSGMVSVMLACDPVDADGNVTRLQRLADQGDRYTMLAASQWLSHMYENAGDPVRAKRAAEQSLALARDQDGPWARALPRAVLAQLAMDMGDRAAAVEHAEAALPIMRRLGAGDDEIELRALLVLCAIADGRLADAENQLGHLDSVGDGTVSFGAAGFREICRAELTLASGDIEAGLRGYRDYADRMRELRFPGMAGTGTEPWTVSGEAAALTAHAHYAADGDVACGQALLRSCRERALIVLSPANPNLDYPVAGMLLFALGAWTLLRETGSAASVDDALRLLAIADRFAYSRRGPVMLWDRIAGPAQDAAPGRLAELRAACADRPLPDLLGEALTVVRRLQMPSVASY